MSKLPPWIAGSDSSARVLRPEILRELGAEGEANSEDAHHKDERLWRGFARLSSTAKHEKRNANEHSLIEGSDPSHRKPCLRRVCFAAWLSEVFDRISPWRSASLQTSRGAWEIPAVFLNLLARTRNLGCEP